MLNVLHIFCYAEFGIYISNMARNVCEQFPKCELHLFDFNDTVQRAEVKLSVYSNRNLYFGNTQRFNDDR
jgi:hypothetical protein